MLYKADPFTPWKTVIWSFPCYVIAHWCKIKLLNQPFLIYKKDSSNCAVFIIICFHYVYFCIFACHCVVLFPNRKFYSLGKFERNILISEHAGVSKTALKYGYVPCESPPPRPRPCPRPRSLPAPSLTPPRLFQNWPLLKTQTLRTVLRPVVILVWYMYTTSRRYKLFSDAVNKTYLVSL